MTHSTTPASVSDGVRTLTADIAIIGAGSGGLSVAAGAAMLGLKVVLFERHKMGGDCLNYGCVPSKALLAAAKTAATVRESGKFGIKTSAPEVSWEAVKAHVQGVIDTIAPVDSQERFEGLGVTVIREAARFADRNTVASDTVRVKARRIVIATGSTAAIPPIPGLADVPFLTNETIFSVAEKPNHLIVLGGGPIGMEMAQAFVRLGSQVTLIEQGRVLGRADAEQARMAADIVRAEGVTLLEGHSAKSVSGQAGAITVHAEHNGQGVTVTGTHLLVALGRRPVLDGLNLEAAGVTHTRAGITTKANLRSVSNPRVWAVGDAAGRGQFTHLAGFHASVFVRNALFKSRFSADAWPCPAVTYLAPEIAQIGLTEAEARKKHGDKVSVGRFAFHENDRAIAERHDHGDARIIVYKGKILGASILGDGAGDLIQIVALAMSNGLGVRALTSYIPPYPSRGEIVKRAASAHFQPLVFGAGARRLVGLLQRIG
jgi:pyruvate/2-oxoglutarate dehydrogenase complex dihydrolipoamide dehydrogenase (E3) component